MLKLGFKRGERELWELSVLPSDNPVIAHRVGSLKVSDVSFDRALSGIRYIIGKRLPDVEISDAVEYIG